MNDVLKQINEHTITFQYHREDLRTEYVCFFMAPTSLYIDYLADKNTVVKHERILLSDCPEIERLYDGSGWNLGELASWIMGLEVADLAV